MLEVHKLNAGYGRSQVLFDLEIRAAAKGMVAEAWAMYRRSMRSSAS